MSNVLKILKPTAMGKTLTEFFLTSADEVAGSTFIKRAPGSPKHAQATRGWKCVGRVS